jgi:hypothetical protein
MVTVTSLAASATDTATALRDIEKQIPAQASDASFKRRLIERAGRAAQVIERLPGGADSLAGGLMVYCAGCMLAVDDEMPNVAREVGNSMGGAPFVGCFTFGEQGFMADRNMHGNLMISAIAFGR